MPVQLLPLFFLELSKKIWQKYHLSIHLPIHLSICLLIHPSIYSFFHPPIHPLPFYPKCLIPVTLRFMLSPSRLFAFSPAASLNHMVLIIPTSSCHLVFQFFAWSHLKFSLNTQPWPLVHLLFHHPSLILLPYFVAFHTFHDSNCDYNTFLHV